MNSEPSDSFRFIMKLSSDEDPDEVKVLIKESWWKSNTQSVIISQAEDILSAIIIIISESGPVIDGLWWIQCIEHDHSVCAFFVQRRACLFVNSYIIIIQDDNWKL